MWKINILVALLATLALKCEGIVEDPVVSVISPRSIRQGQEVYRIAVTTNALKKAVSIDFKLSGVEDASKSNFEKNLNNQKVGSDQLKHFVFKTANLKPGKYQLFVNITDPNKGISYTDTLPLVYRKVRFSFLIQLDMPRYRPGDLVQFRVFAIDSETRPYNPVGAVVSILDSGSNSVKSFTNVTFSKGKYQNSLQLSDNPPMNQWLIRVSAENEVFDKYFVVDDYVLPMYSVEIENQPQVAVTESSFTIKITPIYTFGQMVEGDAVITIYQESWMWWDFGGPQRTVLYTRSIHIKSGSETIEVRIKEDLGLTNANGGYNYLNIAVTFTSTLTKAKTEAFSSITIVPFAYTTVITGDPYFKPNVPYTAKISLRKFDGRSAPAGITVTVNIQLSSNCVVNNGIWSCPYKSLPTQTYTTDATGSVNVIVNHENYDYLNIQANSPISEFGYAYASKQSQFMNQIQAEVLTKNPRINSRLDIQVTTSLKTLDHCFYHVMAKGVMLESKRIKIVNQTATLTLTPSFSYAPQANLIFFYYDQFAQIVSTQVYLSFLEDLPNYLDLNLSVNTTEPGNNVSLCVSSAIKSRASLLAIDQSVLLLGEGNDVSKGDVLYPMYKYISYEGTDYQSPPDEMQFEYQNMGVMKFILKGYQRPQTTTTPKPTTTTTSKWETSSDIMSQTTPGGTMTSSEVMPTSTLLPMPAPESEMDQSKVVNGIAAPDQGGGGGGAPKPIRVRKDFFQVILWQDVDITDAIFNGKQKDKFRGKKCFDFTAPDSITSYILSGVSMNDVHGIGLPQTRPKLTVFLPFFIDSVLPYSIKRGEVVQQDLYLFNYLESQRVLITIMKNDLQYEFLEPEFDGWHVECDRLWQNVSSVVDSPLALRFVFKPLVLGYVELKIEARGSVAGDSILKKLKVIPEGIPKSVTNSTLIMKNQTSSSITTVLTCTLTPTAVNDTTSAVATIVGDLLGDTLSNLANLIQMSYGCGEQNLLNLVPNIVVLNYLTVTNQITADLRSRGISYGEDGYQRQLSYRRSDGSFSAFGESDPLGSTWLTAYCIKTFILAERFFPIDQNVLTTGLDFILSKQSTSGVDVGRVREDGNVIHKDMQGGSSNGLALTAYVAIVLTEGLAKYPQYQAARDSALNYIVQHLDVTDVYDMAISCYALQLANHQNFTSFYQKFLDMRIETADKVHWEKPGQVQDANSWSYWNQPRSSDIEISAYALLIVARRDLVLAAKIAKYLVSQKTAFGGYGSSQDTVVGIAALAEFSVLFHATAGTLDFTLTPDLGNPITAQVSPTNLLNLQTFDLDPLARRLGVFCSAPSKGSAIVSLTCNFYELQVETSPRFVITHSFVRSCKKSLRSRICINYVARPGDDESNMALVKMTFPSGYIYNAELKPSVPKLKLVEVVDDATVINIYFDLFDSNGQCFDIYSTQTCTVDKLKPSYIQVTDYYETFKTAQLFYNVPDDLPECQDLPPEEETTTSLPSPPTRNPIGPRPFPIDFVVEEA